MIYSPIVKFMRSESHPEQPVYSRFKDRVQSTAQKRGAEIPTWEDVLTTASGFSSTQAILIDQKISPNGLERDILYSLNFGRPEMVQDQPRPRVRDIYSRAVESLASDVDTYRASQLFMSGGSNKVVADRFIGYLGRYIDERGSAIDDPDNLWVVRTKIKLLGEVIEPFIAQFEPSFPIHELLGMQDDEVRDIERGNRQFTVDVMEKFTSYVLSKSRLIGVEEQPLKYFDALDKAKMATEGFGITPFEIVDATRKTVDPYLRYLLYRNGMLAPEGYEAPCVMPPPTIIEHALEALSFVEDNRQEKVEAIHLLPGLIANSEVRKLLVDIDPDNTISEKSEDDPFARMFGVSREYSRNFIKFYKVVTAALAPQTEEGDSFRVAPEITEELRDFLKQAENAVKKGSVALAPARLFGELLKRREVRSILFKAGLNRDHLKRWPAALKKAATAKEKEEQSVKEQLQEAFKVDDKKLEDLLEEYGSERTKLALNGKLDPVIGREHELSEMIRILMQRGKSNPLLLGEAGVGKSVLFDGLALMIASGNVPRSMLGARVITIDLNAMNSGAMFRGDFEGKLLPIVQGVAERNAKGDKPPIYLCIDELHSALDAGSAIGASGAGELLKPALARGELAIIGATTQADYAKHIQQDKALSRRFEPIDIKSPDYESTVAIVEGLTDAYEKYHKITFPKDLVPPLVRLTDRYLPNLYQPDKAISAMDASYARARMAEAESVDMRVLIDTIAALSHLDPKFLQEDEGARYLKLFEEISHDVRGQDEALRQITDTLVLARADLHDPNKPLAKFLLLGPTGVGKTETAKALARRLFGTEDALVRIDMENMREAHEDSRLIGSPPGFIGHEKEGELTGAVRRKPYAVVLLDEIEKAHPDVFQRLLPMLDEGELVDGRGEKVSFRNTIILMSSNLGVEEARKAYLQRASLLRTNAERLSWSEVTKEHFERAVRQRFSPEFLNRLDGQIIYDRLSQDIIKELVAREIQELSQRASFKWGVDLVISDTSHEQLATEGYSDEYGARQLKRTVRSKLGVPFATWLLQHEGQIERGRTIEVSELGDNFSPQVR